MATSPSISVLLSGMSRILGDIVRSALADAPDVEIAGGPVDVESTPAVARDFGPSVVICGTPPDAAPGLYEALLEADPRLRIVELAGDGRHVRVHRLAPQVVELGEISLAGLVAVVRGD